MGIVDWFIMNSTTGPFTQTHSIPTFARGSLGCDHMVVGFTTTYAISGYHYHYEFEPCSGEVYSIQHYVIELIGDLL